MREPRYNIFADIQDAIEQAKLGKLALYWQHAIQREYCCKKVTPAEQQAYEQLQSVLSEVLQWSDDEELRSEIEEIGGRVRFCHFWDEHHSMADLILPTFWIETLPRKCAGRLHCWRRKKLRTVCRNGAFCFWMRLFRNR